MIHPSVVIHPTAVINCETIAIDEGGVIGENCIIEGHRVIIGRNFWMDTGAVIGGGSCHDRSAYLHAGDFLHMGRNSQLNIARGIYIGDEVGIGIQTQVFTHGVYLSELEGFPIQFEKVVIGSRVWLPNAWVNPGVTIGDNVVVAARSLINSDLPSGCLAAGSPARVIRENMYPRDLSLEEKQNIIVRIVGEAGVSACINGEEVFCLDTVFNFITRDISGYAHPSAEKLRNQMRRHGIRFCYSVVDGRYVKWVD